MMTSRLKAIAKQSLKGGGLRVVSWFYNHLPLNNSLRIKGKNNVLRFNGNFLRRCNIVIKGSGNQIIFNAEGRNFLSICKIKIYGNNNRVFIHGERNSFVGVEIWIENDGNSFEAGNRCVISGKTHIAITEGKSVVLGDDVLLSSSIHIRTSDSHSILSIANEERINNAQSVSIADRVWIGNRATILKGVEIGSDCVVATGSVLTKADGRSNVIYGGNPAKIIKENIKWIKERI